MSIKRSSLEKRNNVTSSTIGQIHVLPIVENINRFFSVVLIYANTINHSKI